MSKLTNVSPEEKKMLRQLFWRSFPIMSSTNPVSRAGYGFMYALLPVISKYYAEEEDRKQAMIRHSAYYNTTMYISTFPLGLAAAMEKQNAENKDFDTDSITAVKAAIMGPLAGIGDSFFWGTFRVIAAGVGISLAQQGNLLGPILFLLMFHIPHLFFRYYGTFLGYTLGTKFIKEAYRSGMMEIITKAASILGLIMVGAMIATMVPIKTALSLQLSGEPLVIQDILDSIMLGIVPLGATLGVFSLIRKKIRPDKVMWGLMASAVILSLLGVI